MELYVPIRRQSLLVGILALGSKASEAPYTAQDLDVLSTLADQTAVALQNARLVSDLKSLNADMTDLNDELTRTNRRLEKLDAAKTNFIQIASHELRTPLTQVRGYADIMADAVQSGTPTPAQMAQISQGISRATVRLEEIISAMLDVSQIDIEALSLRLTTLSITTVVRMAAENYQQRASTAPPDVDRAGASRDCRRSRATCSACARRSATLSATASSTRRTGAASPLPGGPCANRAATGR